MKKVILLSIIFFCTYVSSSQSCKSDYMLFSTTHHGEPKIIHDLGSSPQMDFLRGIRNPKELMEQIFKNRKKPEKYRRDIEELDKVLKIIGFPNGINDVNLTQNSLSSEYITKGWKGNLGSDDHGYAYVEFDPKNPDGLFAWKITSPTNCFFYIFSKCGNLFYPTGDTKCICPDINIDIKNKTEVKTIPINCIQKEVPVCIKISRPGESKSANRSRGSKSSQGVSKNRNLLPQEFCIIREVMFPICSSTSVTVSAKITSNAYTASPCENPKGLIDNTLVINEKFDNVAPQLDSKPLELVMDKRTFKRLYKLYKEYIVNCSCDFKPNIPQQQQE